MIGTDVTIINKTDVPELGASERDRQSKKQLQYIVMWEVPSSIHSLT